MQYNTAFKDLFPDVQVLFTSLTHSHLVKIESVEFTSVKQRRADLVVWLANNLTVENRKEYDWSLAGRTNPLIVAG